MINVLLFRFQQFLGPSTMLLVQGYSEAILFWYLSNSVFGSPQFRKYVSYECHLFFWIFSKFYLDFKNVDKNWEKLFCFWDNCIWIGCCRYCLLRREYLSWAVNVLKNGLKIFHITKSDFFQLNCLNSNQKLW